MKTVPTNQFVGSMASATDRKSAVLKGQGSVKMQQGFCDKKKPK
jgi:hypothetical protein